MIGPILQDQNYHRFADARGLFGVDHAADVLSNVAFVAVGIVGMVALRQGRVCFQLPAEARAYWSLFTAVALTGAGSAYYHLAPDDARLVWDRLPMAAGFASLLCAVISERLDARSGVRLLAPLLAVGVASVLYWAASGDLRLYLAVQYGSIAGILAMGLWFPSRYTGGGTIVLAVATYALAKISEAHDRAVYELTGHLASGHTIKHLLAAAALYLIAWSLARRQPVAATSGAYL